MGGVLHSQHPAQPPQRSTGRAGAPLLVVGADRAVGDDAQPGCRLLLPRTGSASPAAPSCSISNACSASTAAVVAAASGQRGGIEQDDPAARRQARRCRAARAADRCRSARPPRPARSGASDSAPASAAGPPTSSTCPAVTSPTVVARLRSLGRQLLPRVLQHQVVAAVPGRSRRSRSVAGAASRSGIRSRHRRNPAASSPASWSRRGAGWPVTPRFRSAPALNSIQAGQRGAGRRLLAGAQDPAQRRVLSGLVLGWCLHLEHFGMRSPGRGHRSWCPGSACRGARWPPAATEHPAAACSVEALLITIRCWCTVGLHRGLDQRRIGSGRRRGRVQLHLVEVDPAAHQQAGAAGGPSGPGQHPAKLLLGVQGAARLSCQVGVAELRRWPSPSSRGPVPAGESLGLNQYRSRSHG